MRMDDSGRYEIREMLGCGGMGEVFRARDLELRRDVAIKLFSRDRAIEFFEKEARIHAQLIHEFVVRVYDTVAVDGSPGLVMEVAKGRTLRECFEEKKRYPFEILPILRRVARGLEHIHSQGILHLDLKPANVMYEARTGSVKILDFGVSKLLKASKISWSCCGTPGYMAPELILGCEPGPRTDLFSLGALAYRVLATRSPFPGNDRRDILEKTRTHPQVPVMEINPLVSTAFSNLLDELLAKAPEDRPSSASEVATRLREIERESITLPFEPGVLEVCQEYYSSLAIRHEEIPVPGFETRLGLPNPPLKIEDVYVPRRLEGLSGSAEVSRVEQLLGGALRGTRARGPQGFVVLGEAGSGKTTWLKHLLLAELKAQRSGPGARSCRIPVYLQLREMEDLGAGIEAALVQALTSSHKTLDPPFGRQLYAGGRLLFLIDGLDEVADREQRVAVARWLERALEQSPEHLFVVTSRPSGYDSEVCLSESFLELQLCPLEEDETRRFCMRWYESVERSVRVGVSEEECRARVAAAADSLVAMILDPEEPRVDGLRQMARNPLFLHCLCLANREQRVLLARRSDLFRECLLGLLGLWPRSYHLEVDLAPEEAVRLLQPLSFSLLDTGCQAIELEKVQEALKEPLRALRRDETDVERLIDGICRSSGALERRPDGTYTFPYQSFQEYLAARHILQQSYRSSALLKQVCSRYGEPRWREVVLLVLGSESSGLFEPLMKRLLKKGALHQDQRLAEDCIEDAWEARPHPFLAKLAQGPRQLRPPDRRVALSLLEKIGGWHEVEIDRRTGREIIQSVARLDPEADIKQKATSLLGDDQLRIHEKDGSVLVEVSGREYELGCQHQDYARPSHRVRLRRFFMTRGPVTNEQYGKFIEATKAPEPKNWQEPRFSQPDQPVVGISWEEACAYCHWTGGVLPTEAQWEVAARGSDRREYPWGDEEPSTHLANFESLGPSAVGSRESEGPFGTYDQAGNVWEWCLDTWDPRAYEGRDGQQDPVSERGYVAERVIRGGAWNTNAWALTTSFRQPSGLSSRRNDIGFRVVYSPDSTASASPSRGSGRKQTRRPALWAALLLLVALLALLRLPSLDADFPHEYLGATAGSAVEEGYKTQAARLAQASSDRGGATALVFPPQGLLDNFLYRLAFVWLGLQVESPRMFSILMYSLLLLGFAWASREYPRRLALFGLVFLGLQQILFFYSRIATQVTTATVLFYGALFCIREIYRSRRLVWYRFEVSSMTIFLVSLFLALGLGAHHLVFPLFLFLGLLFAEGAELSRKAMKSPSTVGFLLLPWLPFLLLPITGVPVFDEEMLTLQSLSSSSWLLHPLTETSPFLVAGGLICGALIAIIHPARFIQNNAYLSTLFFLVALGPALIALFQTQLRYYVPLLPAYPLLILEWIAVRGWNVPVPSAGRESLPRKAISLYLLTLSVLALIKGGNEWILQGIALLLPDSGDTDGFSNRVLVALGLASLPFILFLYWQRRSIAKLAVRVTTLNERDKIDTIELNLRNVLPGLLLGLLLLSSFHDAAAITSYLSNPLYDSRKVAEQLTAELSNGGRAASGDVVVIGDWAPYLLMGTQVKTDYPSPRDLDETIVAWVDAEQRPTHFLRTLRREDPNRSSSKALDGDQQIFEILQASALVSLGEPVSLPKLWTRELALYPLSFDP